MPSPRDVLTPDSLAMLQVIADTGSFAAAARQLQLVPSALTYRVRQLEEALDVLLFDRSTRQAQPTPAGQALLKEGARLLQDLEAVAHRVKRIATGWEPELKVIVDSALSTQTVLDLVEAFYTLQAPTQLRVSRGTLSGPLEALAQGKADLALGISNTPIAGQQVRDLGDMTFHLAVAPFHPLASANQPITDEMLKAHRLIVVADSALKENTSMGLLEGQEILTVDNLQTKIQAQLRGIGCGFLPENLLLPYQQNGSLIIKKVCRSTRQIRMRYAWTLSNNLHAGRALQWWIEQLESPTTRNALVQKP